MFSKKLLLEFYLPIAIALGPFMVFFTRGSILYSFLIAGLIAFGLRFFMVYGRKSKS